MHCAISRPSISEAVRSDELLSALAGVRYDDRDTPAHHVPRALARGRRFRGLPPVLSAYNPRVHSWDRKRAVLRSASRCHRCVKPTLKRGPIPIVVGVGPPWAYDLTTPTLDGIACMANAVSLCLAMTFIASQCIATNSVAWFRFFAVLVRYVL